VSADWATPPMATWVLVGAYLIDRFCGELPNAVHPVAWMGKCAAWLASPLHRAPIPMALLGGALVALILPAASAGVGLLPRLVDPPLLRGLLETCLLSTAFAIGALGAAVRVVSDALRASDLGSARRATRALCSRDPSSLTSSQVSAAAIESAAENTCDSVVAPLFYYALFGLPGAWAYRAINTLDAMLGYHGRFEYLGKASARLDDLANLIPARLTTTLLWLAAPKRSALRVWRRDAHLTESPNAGHPMAMMAGLLNVELQKPGAYRLGSGLPEPRSEDVERALRIVERASGLWVVAIAALCWGLA